MLRSWPPTPTTPALLIAHGQNLIRQLKNAEAFAAFTKATELDPADADAWSGLAFAASTTQHPDVSTSRSYDAIKVSSGYSLDVFSMGNILRYIAR